MSHATSIVLTNPKVLNSDRADHAPICDRTNDAISTDGEGVKLPPLYTVWAPEIANLGGFTARRRRESPPLRDQSHIEKALVLQPFGEVQSPGFRRLISFKSSNQLSPLSPPLNLPGVDHIASSSVQEEPGDPDYRYNGGPQV